MIRSDEFKPKDQELLLDYLYNKVNGHPLPINGVIFECDLYGDKEPWEIWESLHLEKENNNNNNNNNKDLYVFTELKKKNLKGSRFGRRIATGSWGGEDSGTKIYCDDDDGTKKVIGIKKRFRYENSGSMHEGRWLMHQYSLDASFLHHAKFQNYVVCRIRKNGDYEKKKKRKPGELPEIAQMTGTDGPHPKKIRIGGKSHIKAEPIDENELVLFDTEEDEKILLEQGDDDQLNVSMEPIFGDENYDYINWKESFAEELLRGQSQQPMQEIEMEILPNNYYHEIWTNGGELLSK